MSPTDTSKGCLLVKPVPINMARLIQDTRRNFSVVMKSLRTSWRALAKKKFPQLYARREDLSTTPDGFLCLNDRTTISTTLKRAVLEGLHSSHLRVEKMKSLARLIVWWPELDADLARHAKNCQECFQKKPKQPSKWSPRPMATEPWQRLHLDYCGPFLRELLCIDRCGRIL